MPIVVLNILLVIVLYSCTLTTGSLRRSTTPSEIMWTKTESPLFPVTWPPTAETVWVRYTFAYGTDLANLRDGSYVTYPLSKTEWKSGRIYATTELRKDMTQAGIQGVVPVDSETRKILENAKQVSEHCLKMTALPTPNTSASKEVLAYYQVWFKYNGAFLGLIKDNHKGFVDWVVQNKGVG